MLVVTVRCARQWLESIEDQVPADVSREVQTSKSDLMARGVAFNLLQMAKRISPQCKAAEYEDLSGEKSLTLDRSSYSEASHCGLIHLAIWSRLKATPLAIRSDSEA